MSRRHAAEKREILPDPKFGDLVISKFMNCLMYDGKKSAAEQIVYGAFDAIAGKTKAIRSRCSTALDNVKPAIEAALVSVAPPTRCRSKCGTIAARALAIR